MCDKEHALASLWASEILQVKNPVGEPKPALCQRPEEGSKSPSSVCRQDTNDIFPKYPLDVEALSQLNKLKCEPPLIAVKPLTKSCNGIRLAGRSSAKESNRLIWVRACGNGFAGFIVACGRGNAGKVTIIGSGWIVVAQHGAGVGFNLGVEHGLEAEFVPCRAKSLSAGAYACVIHLANEQHTTSQSKQCATFISNRNAIAGYADMFCPERGIQLTEQAVSSLALAGAVSVTVRREPINGSPLSSAWFSLGKPGVFNARRNPAR